MREKKTCKAYYRSRLVVDKIAFQRARARVRHLTKTSRVNLWKQYTEGFNQRTSINKVWKKGKKIEGRYFGTRTLVSAGPTGIISDPGDMANTFCEILSVMPPCSNSLQFLQYKRKVEHAPPPPPILLRRRGGGLQYALHIGRNAQCTKAQLLYGGKG